MANPAWRAHHRPMTSLFDSPQDRRRVARSLTRLAACFALGAAGLAAGHSHAADEAPDVMIRRLSAEILAAIRSDPAVQAGNFNRVIALVDKLVMPNLNFERITASAVGPGWREATPQQKHRLEEEFKRLLVRTYSGALNQVGDQQVTVKPLRAGRDDTEVVVRTLVRGHGEPVAVDYRLEHTPGVGAGWKVYDLNVLGVWLVQTYRGQFAGEINAHGIDGLIAALASRNTLNDAAR
ncbi:MAG: hypothetical protein JWQ88_2332 [Rhodoferax sp.]|nr:hypothetical protein [Rhodoferax sp.]